MLQSFEHLHAGQPERDFAGREAAAFDHGLVGVHQSLRLRGIESNAQRLREQNDVGSSRLSVDADYRAGADSGGIAPEVCPGVLAFAAAVHAGPGAKCARADDGSAVRRLQPESRVSRVRQAGKPGKRFGSDKFSFAPELHAADDGGQIHVAAALARSQKRALNLNRPGKNGGAGIGNSQTAIGVAVKSEFDIGVTLHQSARSPELTSSGPAPPVVSQTISRLTFWRTHCSMIWWK